MRVGIVGCGWAGARHAKAFRAAGADVAWAVDREVSRARSLGADQSTPDLGVALADPTLRAISVCLPHALHAEAAIASISAGKHVLVEKPMAASLEEADRMIHAAETAGVVLMVAETVRFDQTLLQTAELVHSGVVELPALVQVTRQAYLRESFMTDRPWFLDAQLAAGGILMSGGIHDFEVLRMLLGEPSSIYAVRVRQRFIEMQGDDTSVAIVNFSGGTTATMIESFAMKTLTTASGSEQHTVRIDGDLGSLYVDVPKQRIRLFSEDPNPQWANAPAAHELHVPASDPFELEARHFLTCIRDNVEPMTSGRSQRRTLQLVLAAYESMTRGMAVSVS